MHQAPQLRRAAERQHTQGSILSPKAIPSARGCVCASGQRLKASLLRRTPSTRGYDEDCMNPANLQLEGLYAAVAALMQAIRDKGLLSAQELEGALAEAETKIVSDPARRPGLSGANRDAICFPLRFLRAANQTSAEGRQLSFSELTILVGQTKPD
jgi:hypothetical protein